MDNVLDSPVGKHTFHFYSILSIVLIVNCFIGFDGQFYWVVWQVLFFGIVDQALCYERKIAWFGRGATPRGYPNGNQWGEFMSAYGFESKAIRVLVTFVPLLVILFIQNFRDQSTFENACRQSWNDMANDIRYGEETRFVHMTFAVLLGVMISDCVSVYFKIRGYEKCGSVADDNLLLFHMVHHILVIFFGISFEWLFPDIKGVRMIAIVTCIMEIGSLAYLLFTLYGMRIVMRVVGSWSNLTSWVVGLYVFWDDLKAGYFWTWLLTVLGTILIAVREFGMVTQLNEAKIRNREQEDGACLLFVVMLLIYLHFIPVFFWVKNQKVFIDISE